MRPSTCHFVRAYTNRTARRTVGQKPPQALHSACPPRRVALAKKPNYNLEKNRREQDRKKKKEEKRLRRLENRSQPSEEGEVDPDGVEPPPAE